MAEADAVPTLEFTAVQRGPNVLLVELCGMLRQAVDLTGFHEAVRRALTAAKVNVVLDMAKVPFVDSFGLGFLMILRREIVKAGGMLKLARPNEGVVKALAYTRIDSIIPVVMDLNEATQPPKPGEGEPKEVPAPA
jgi:anti-anti-sigma factor